MDYKIYVDENGKLIGYFGGDAKPKNGGRAVSMPPPSNDYVWDGSKWVEPETPIEQLRANASMPRAEFLQACVSVGIIDPDVAEEAASGAWPGAFDAFLTGLPVAQRIEAKATWVDGQRVRRNSPILALIADEQGVTDAQLDALFGIGG